MLSQLQGQLLGLLAPSVPTFSMTPRAAQVPALCLSFPILPVVLSVATHGCCSCPCDLSFPGTEVLVSVVCGLVAQFPETRGSITHGPAPCTVLAQQEGVGRQRTLQLPGMPIPGLGWMHQAGNSKGWRQDPAVPSGEGGLVAPMQGVRGCWSGMCWDEVWEVAGALQDQGKQEHEGCDNTGGSGIGGPA